MKTIYRIAVALLLTSQVQGYCDTSARSKRDCELCKVSLQNATQVDCENPDVGGPCFWNDSTDTNPYAGWTNTECGNGGGGPSGGGGRGGGGDSEPDCKGGPKKCGGRLRG